MKFIYVSFLFTLLLMLYSYYSNFHISRHQVSPKILGVQSYLLLPLPNRFVTFILNEGLREHELGVLGIENPLESCSIGEDDIIIDAPEKLG